MTREEIEKRFAEINALAPESLTPEEEAAIAEAEAMDDGSLISYEDLRAELLAIDEARRAGKMKSYTVEEVLAHIDAKIKQAEVERLEDELDRIAYEKAMAEYRANPVTYTMEEVRAMLDEEE